ncbi:unnamed protein product, partial [Prorocentrum cordatum]
GKSEIPLGEFMGVVLERSKGAVPDDFIKRCKHVAGETTEGGGSWMPWPEAPGKEGKDALLEMVHAGAAACRRAAADGQPAAQPKSGQGAPPPSEKDKATVPHLRKTHATWDRQRRGFDATVSMSKTHGATEGCLFETELGAALSNGTAL